jgi:predicted acylesterase/phospholipase RssA
MAKNANAMASGETASKELQGMTNQVKKVLFVMSGGGMPGLDIHVGIWRALEDMGIFATEISGTSAGAIVGAMNASLWDPCSAEEYLRFHKDDDFRHERPFWKVRFPWLESIHDNDRIMVSLDGVLPLKWDGMKKPFSAWACKKRNGELVNVARPELADRPAMAVLASMSICGFFPSVPLLDGEDYIDGGYRFNLPLLNNWRDFDEVYLMIAKPRPADYQGTGILTNLIRNLNIVMLNQIADVLDHTQNAPAVRVIWPILGGETSMLRFNHDLIGQAYAFTINNMMKEVDV